MPLTVKSPSASDNDFKLQSSMSKSESSSRCCPRMCCRTLGVAPYTISELPCCSFLMTPVQAYMRACRRGGEEAYRCSADAIRVSQSRTCRYYRGPRSLPACSPFSQGPQERGEACHLPVLRHSLDKTYHAWQNLDPEAFHEPRDILDEHASETRAEVLRSKGLRQGLL